METSGSSLNPERPRLKLASQPDDASSEAPPKAGRDHGIWSRVQRDPRLTLSALLGLALLGLLAQSWRAEVLSSQLGVLELRLESAQQLIEQHEVHLQRVQGSVGALLDEVQELDRLVHASPGRAGTADPKR